jgi:hypothetical protein
MNWTAAPVIALVMMLSSTGAGLSNPALASELCGGLRRAADASGEQLPRFVVSYQPGEGEAKLPPALAQTAFTYDNALAAIALVACGDVARASRIANALSLASRSDRTFADGRIRNGYRAGPLETKPPALPGWWDDVSQRWLEDAAQDGTSTGNVAWAALALLTLHEATGKQPYLDDARRLMDWIATNAADDTDGFTGGCHGFDPAQQRLTWKSTEHNVDVHAAAAWLHRLTGDDRALAMAASARRFLDRMYDDADGHFEIGTNPDGSRAQPGKLALDTQLWPLLAVADAPRSWRRALQFAERHFRVGDGFDFDADRDGVWVEGTAQAVLAFRHAGEASRHNELLDSLHADRSASGLLNATRTGTVSTGLSIDPTRTVADLFYFRRPHLGATAWGALAALGFNPFTGRRID